MVFRSVREDHPGPRIAEVLRAYWPAYRRWIARGPNVAPDDCVAALRRHMPELLPTFDAIMTAIDGGDDEMRFLSLYRPPRLVRACSQLVLETDEGSVLVRNYDHAPHLCDGLVLRSAWNGAGVIAPTDCLWGALDGVNEHGLAIALAFGGRPVVGDGFSASLVARYVLETCTTVAEARAALSRIPVYMAYTFVVVDGAGEFTTAYCSPDRDAHFEREAASTNHQGQSEWSRYVRFSNSVERLEHLQALTTTTDRSVQAVVEQFLAPPLYRNEYSAGSGTLYTAAVNGPQGVHAMHWPHDAMTFTFGEFDESTLDVELGVR